MVVTFYLQAIKRQLHVTELDQYITEIQPYYHQISCTRKLKHKYHANIEWFLKMHKGKVDIYLV